MEEKDLNQGKEQGKVQASDTNDNILIEESKAVKIFGEECLMKKVKEIEDFIGKLMFMKVDGLSYGDYKKTIQRESSKLINSIILSTVGSEGDIIYWKGVEEKAYPNRYINNYE